MPITLAPLVIPIERQSTLQITGLLPDTECTVRVRAVRQEGPASEYSLRSDSRGRLSFQSTCALRGEYAVDVSTGAATSRLFFYALASDLFGRRPLRCDFHIHTQHSDGDSSPAQMMLRGRELGLDVAVLTDHDCYAPSLEAVDVINRLDLGLITGPGEEVSGPNWHIVAINADTSIHDLGVQAQRFGGDAAWEYDSMRWVVRTTQEHGGRAYLAHPYWAIARGYHLPSPWYDSVLQESILDGIELLGDVKHENNARSLARYLDFRASGNDIPILGNSDTHSAEHTYGAYWTLAFAKEPTLESALEAIADGWSVACTTAGRTGESRAERLWALGSFELVDYAYFLEQQFFPTHDRLCAQQAALARRTWRGDPPNKRATEDARTAIEDLYSSCLCGNPMVK